jgi:hypothetical protein
VETIILWDVGGEYSHILNADYLHGCGVAFVVDASHELSVHQAKAFCSKVHSECHRSGIPICVLANKQDVAGALSGQQVSRALRSLETVQGTESFQREARMLWLVCYRKGCPQDIRRLCLQHLIDICDGPVVFETCFGYNHVNS